MPGNRWLLAAFTVTVFFWVFVAVRTLGSNYSIELDAEAFGQLASMREQIVALEKKLNLEEESLKRLQGEVAMRNERRQKVRGDRQQKSDIVEIKPIAVLVFACNRPSAVRQHVGKLLSLRPSEALFPIVVSQDCDSAETSEVIKELGEKVKYIKHVSGQNANLSIPPEHRRYSTYYMIARHYKLALEYVFGNLKHQAVIITEDDLDIAPDFFEYFLATRRLLDEDKSLFCVSAWNDNGKAHTIDSSASDLLYRSDFFPGLGWMMTKELWKEVSSIWPSGFWDDWLREPERRKNRSCIRPEISRTAMTGFGENGASKGLFFKNHLAKIVLNTQKVNFTVKKMDYLEKNKYDTFFKKAVYEESKPVSIDEVFRIQPRRGSVRIYYDGNIDYVQKAKKLGIMPDFKAGVPRTAYEGVVSVFLNGLRVYLVPNATLVHGYDKKWEVPLGMAD